jgi:hypothetical protein
LEYLDTYSESIKALYMFVKLYEAVTLSDKEAVVVLLSSVLNISLRYIGIIGTITIYSIFLKQLWNETEILFFYFEGFKKKKDKIV